MDRNSPQHCKCNCIVQFDAEGKCCCRCPEGKWKREVAAVLLQVISEPVASRERPMLLENTRRECENFDNAPQHRNTLSALI